LRSEGPANRRPLSRLVLHRTAGILPASRQLVSWPGSLPAGCTRLVAEYNSATNQGRQHWAAGALTRHLFPARAPPLACAQTHRVCGFAALSTV